MWVVDHMEAAPLLMEWAMMLTQASRAVGLTIEADMPTELMTERMIVSVTATAHTDTPSIMEGG